MVRAKWGCPHSRWIWGRLWSQISPYEISWDERDEDVKGGRRWHALSVIYHDQHLVRQSLTTQSVVHRAAASVLPGNSVETQNLQPDLLKQTPHLTRPQAIHMHTQVWGALFEIYIKRYSEAWEYDILHPSVPELGLITNLQVPTWWEQ